MSIDGYAQTETQIVAACLRLLQLSGIFAWRNNTGAARVIGKGGKTRPMRFGYVGSADILGVLPGGRFLAVECKKGKGKQTEAQADFERRITEAGGVYWLVRSMDETEAKLDEWARAGRGAA